MSDVLYTDKIEIFRHSFGVTLKFSTNGQEVVALGMSDKFAEHLTEVLRLQFTILKTTANDRDLDKLLKNMGVSTRTYNALMKYKGIRTLRDLLRYLQVESYESLGEVRNMGDFAMKEIKEILLSVQVPAEDMPKEEKNQPLIELAAEKCRR